MSAVTVFWALATDGTGSGSEHKCLVETSQERFLLHIEQLIVEFATRGHSFQEKGLGVGFYHFLGGVDIHAVWRTLQVFAVYSAAKPAFHMDPRGHNNLFSR